MQSYCLLTGGKCGHHPITPIVNSFFIAEPYDDERSNREETILEVIKGHKHLIADEDVMNVALTCKICNMIQACNYGIVDISGLNSNVLIELGMLYGFNKPTIILVKNNPKNNGKNISIKLKSLLKGIITNNSQKTSNIKIEIPSNVKGIEQIRYKSYDDLKEKLIPAVARVIQLDKRLENEILDFAPFLIKEIRNHELAIKLKTDGLVEAKIAEVKSFDNSVNIIINAGTEKGITTNHILDLFVLESSSLGIGLENNIGSIIPIHCQDGASQCGIYERKKPHVFWDNLLQNSQIDSRHILKSQMPKELAERQIHELEEVLASYKTFVKAIRMVKR